MHGKNYVGNTPTATGNITYRTFNPLTNTENETRFYEATSEEIGRAVQLAKEAYKSFSNSSDKKRADFLDTIADEILNLGDELVRTYCAETGLPEGRAKGERGRTIGQLRSFANLLREGSWVEATIDTAIADREPMPKPDIRKMLVALGPIVVFGASNFPLAYSTAGGDTASALAAGCPVVVKSHPMHAGTGELVAAAIIAAVKKTGMPDGVFSNLNSSGIEVGKLLVEHQEVKGVGFTGSIRGGRALFDLAAKREEPIPVFAEMGSINPVILFPEALKNKGQQWAATYAGSITLGSGQFCTNPGLLLGFKGAELTQFITQLSREIIKKEPTSMLHPNIFEAYEKNRTAALAQGVSVTAEYEGDVQTNFARQTVATVDGASFLENVRLHQEVFGPYSLVVQCRDADEMQRIISSLEGQLTGTLLAEVDELQANSGVVQALQNRVGRLIYNGVPTGVEVCPSMHHGGPYPSSTDSRFTAVGIHAIRRWARPVSFQDWPNVLLPDALKNENPLHISRVVNQKMTDTTI